MVSQNIVRSLKDPEDEEARGEMLLAAPLAGVGFGNADCHLPHGMSYPVSGMAREYIPLGYPEGHPIIPHDMCVIMNALAVFRFTAEEAIAPTGTTSYPVGLDPEGTRGEVWRPESSGTA